MASSSATTVAKYLASLPAERRKVVAAVRKMVLKHLPAGYQETMGWGMICYGIPLETYPDTYNGQPLCYTALAAQKNHYALRGQPPEEMTTRHPIPRPLDHGDPA